MSATLRKSQHVIFMMACFTMVATAIYSGLLYFIESLDCPVFNDGDQDLFAAYGAQCHTHHNRHWNGLVEFEWGGQNRRFLCCQYYCQGTGSNEMCAYYMEDGYWTFDWYPKPPVGEFFTLVSHAYHFPSVSMASWFVVTTLTTVGYGDLVAATFGGRIVATFAMVTGIMLIALPIAVVGHKFQEAYMLQSIDNKTTAHKHGTLQQRLFLMFSGADIDDDYHNDFHVRLGADCQKNLEKQKLQEILEAAEPILRRLRTNLARAGRLKELSLLENGERIMFMHQVHHQVWSVTQMLANPDEFRHHLVQTKTEFRNLIQAQMFEYDLGAHKALTLNGQALTEHSLNLFDRHSTFRHWCISCLRGSLFDILMIICIIVNTILMCTENYMSPCDPWNKTLEQVDVFFLIAYSAEFIIKVTALGFVMSPNTYMRDPWNWIDICVVEEKFEKYFGYLH